ncbi:ATP-binding cassette domain-containing protein [Pseudonocardia sp. ICBG1034]|uniref:ATP-binding cassette domain-containing protein n=1 Tax=Pseudonocardia sp. ICBG1034 TaxID=2844381 RepID=UPI0035A983A3
MIARLLARRSPCVRRGRCGRGSSAGETMRGRVAPGRTADVCTRCSTRPRGPSPEGIDLELSPGRTTVLLGPSGVGRTTMVRILPGLSPPESGESLLGPGCRRTPLRHVRSHRGTGRNTHGYPLRSPE